jgi:hypothetical protein
MKNETNIPPPKAHNEPERTQTRFDTPRASYETQDKTTIFEEYLFGNASYAKGGTSAAWADSTKGRMGIRLISRGLFGAAAFTWGGRTASKQLLNYSKKDFQWAKAPPLQKVAYSFDATLGKAISETVRFIAPAKNKDVWAKEAVRFRTKGYFHSTPGKETGRSFGAEVVAITFDFACASVGDASARSVIQSFDPALQKPWRDEDGKIAPKKFAKSVANASWRIFSKNQMEDWFAAIPYVYQMKWQRQTLSRHFPGFKLGSDSAWNGGSMKVNSSGQITGDYQLPGLIDLQFRFMGYNWYTLMYREGYDEVKRRFNNWKEDGFSIHLKAPENPAEFGVKLITEPIRYVAKSFVKAHIYMLPSVPFFWMWRTPQSKWKSGAILDDHKPGQNAIASLNERTAESLHGTAGHVADATAKDAKTKFSFRTATAAGAGRFGIGKDKAMAQGGIYTNPGFVKDGIAGDMWFGEQRVKNLAQLGNDGSVYHSKNQKSWAGKILNPFGKISYKLGSIGTRAMDKIDPNNKFFKFMGSDKLRRELGMRSYIDASLSYTPYFIAKTELALRVDDRGPGGTSGNMDKAIYRAIDNLATFNIRGLRDSVSDMLYLVTHPEKEIPTSEEGIKVKEQKEQIKEVLQSLKENPPPLTKEPASTPSSTIQTATTQLGVEARRNFKKDPTAEPKAHDERWAETVKNSRDVQSRLLYPPHHTIQ